MPRNLLDLAVEIIDKCLEQLLPEIVPHQRHRIRLFPVLPPPTDLIHLLRVCRTLHDLALPWVWRRVYIPLPGDDAHRNERCLYLIDHPEVATHIRTLSLYIEHSDFDVLLRALAVFRPSIPLMKNLRVLQFISGPTYHIIDDMYAELISTSTSLHTLLVKYHMSIPIQISPHRLANLRRLYLTFDFVGHAPLLAVAPTLQVLSISRSRDGLLTLPVHWETVRELSIFKVTRWNEILENFSAWQRASPTTPSPLAAFSIRAPFTHILTAANIRQLLSVLKGQQSLETLSLSSADALDQALVDEVIDTFPCLQFLHLPIVPSFSLGIIDSIPLAKSLQRLQKLRRIHWDLIVHDNELVPAERAWNSIFQDVVPVLAQWCRGLERLKVTVQGKTYSYAVRGEGGGIERR